MFGQHLLIGLAALASSTFISTANAQAVDETKALIAQIASRKDTWTGPTTGPVAQTDMVVLLAGDLTNGGIVGATTGAEEAAAAIGWICA